MNIANNISPKQYEKGLVLNNPDFVGINIDQDYIVNARHLWSMEKYLQYVMERDGGTSQEVRDALDSGKAEKIHRERKEEENKKIVSLYKYLKSYDGKLLHTRIHPAGELSPVTPSQAIKMKPDGTFTANIAPEFVEQVKAIQARVPEVTLVIQFFDHRRGIEKCSNVPETAEQIDQYISLCEKITEIFGKNVQLEVGNETNIVRKVHANFPSRLQFATHVNAREYAQFYFQVAKRVKEKSPSTKLSIAGVACYDPTYVCAVLSELTQLQKEFRSTTQLVDTISFHPYRETPEGGSIEIKNGMFTNNRIGYEEQMDEMQQIAKDYGVNLTVGEVRFEQDNPTKLAHAIELTVKRNIVSYLYPAD